jgi:hypothetical protein
LDVERPELLKNIIDIDEQYAKRKRIVSVVDYGNPCLSFLNEKHQN